MEDDMFYETMVNASLLLAGAVVFWLTGDEIAQMLELGRHRSHRRPRVTVRKVWDSDEPKED